MCLSLESPTPFTPNSSVLDLYTTSNLNDYRSFDLLEVVSKRQWLAFCVYPSNHFEFCFRVNSVPFDVRILTHQRYW